MHFPTGPLKSVGTFQERVQMKSPAIIPCRPFLLADIALRQSVAVLNGYSPANPQKKEEIHFGYMG